MAKKEEQTKVGDVREMKKQLAKLKLDILTGQEKDTSKLKKLKKEIARLLTNTNGKDIK